MCQRYPTRVSAAANKSVERTGTECRRRQPFPCERDRGRRMPNDSWASPTNESSMPAGRQELHSSGGDQQTILGETLSAGLSNQVDRRLVGSMAMAHAGSRSSIPSHSVLCAGEREAGGEVGVQHGDYVPTFSSRTNWHKLHAMMRSILRNRRRGRYVANAMEHQGLSYSW